MSGQAEAGSSLAGPSDKIEILCVAIYGLQVMCFVFFFYQGEFETGSGGCVGADW